MLKLPSAMASSLVLILMTGCQTMPDDAPVEFDQARQALKDADGENVNDMLPSTMEMAHQSYDEAVRHYKEGGEQNRQQAIQEAQKAKALAEAGMSIKRNVRDWDKDPGQYNQLMASAKGLDVLTVELENLKTQNQELRSQLQEQQETTPTAAYLPEDFEVAKPVAFFETGKAQLQEDFRDEIRSLAEMLKKNPELQVQVAGYADPRGSRDLNERLARERANAVANELQRAGVEPNRIEVVSHGATQARAKGMDPGALQLDRKVVARVQNVAH